MKRSWLSILLIAGVIGLLTLFLGLQYNWLSQASAAERERMQKRVEADAKNFADDFNREIQAAYFNFQTGAETWINGDYGEFNDRYDYWKSKTAYPDLINQIVFIPEKGTPTIYSPKNRFFETGALPERIDRIAKFIESEEKSSVIESENALVLPIYEEEKSVKRIVIERAPDSTAPIPNLPEASGHLAIILDESIVRDRILQDLTAKYFPNGDYKTSVVSRSNEEVFGTLINGSDATVPLFDLTPDKLIFFANRDMIPRTVERSSSVVFDQRIESHTVHNGEEKKSEQGKTFKIQMQDGEKGRQRTAVVTSTSSDGNPWTLNVQHTAGSIDEYIRGERNKSFMIGIGVYLLLVGGILAIVLSAMRSRRFAQRQIDFVSSVSHEFRTPLAVIYSAGENLADGVAKDESQVSRYGDLIKGEGKKLSAMVEQILEFAGARSGKKKYNFALANVGDIASNALTECMPLLREKDFRVEQNISNDLPAINVDAGELSRAIQNLIQNAVKYSNGSKWIRVAAENGTGAIKISVEDRGNGIQPSDMTRIFEPFYRSKTAVDAQIHGNGLGLSLVKEIAEAHGGRVTAESTLEKGSKFTLVLPIRK